MQNRFFLYDVEPELDKVCWKMLLSSRRLSSGTGILREFLSTFPYGYVYQVSARAGCGVGLPRGFSLVGRRLDCAHS